LRCRRTSPERQNKPQTPADSTPRVNVSLSRPEGRNARQLQRSAKPVNGSTANRASLGFLAPTASPNKSSDQHREYRSRLRSAFRLSQPLDALLRSCPPGLVSCQIRPWGWGSQRVPPPSSRHGFHRALPLQPYAAIETGRSVGAVPRNDTSATPERTTPRHRSEERRLDTAPNHRPITLRGARRSSDPNEGRVAQGFMHLEGPFTAKWCYPAFAGRASLSL
jgi:hypothetical protein